MKVVFISNYFNHHQKSFSDEMYRLTGGEYRFIATEEMKEERKRLGYQSLSAEYVLENFEIRANKKAYQKIIDEADVVLIGSAPTSLIANRLKRKKLTFCYAERNYKKKLKLYELPLRAVKYYFKYSIHKSLYMLCASAYTAADYAKTGNFLNKTYKWGYFPEVRLYSSIEDILQKKERNSLLWVARFIDWKHPEIPIEIVKKLKADGYNPCLRLIGTGEMEEEISKKIQDEHLEQNIQILGSMPPDKVREYMEQSEIFLFTSDRNEGWGAVLNEAMNSGCAVVASHAIGSVPFLIEDGKNGLIYQDGNLDDLYRKTKFILENPKECASLGGKAYQTMAEQWNAKNAAERLLLLADDLLKGNNKSRFFDGVCSKAEILADDWY